MNIKALQIFVGMVALFALLVYAQGTSASDSVPTSAPASKPPTQSHEGQAAFGSRSPLAPINAGSPLASIGDLDPSFDGDGRVTSNLDYYGTLDQARAVAIQSDGKIVAVGTTFHYDPDPVFPDFYEFSVARYNPDGSPDQTFGGGDGEVTTLFRGWSNVDENGYGVAIQPDGKIVVAGTSNLDYSCVDFTAVRFNPNGDVDGTFGFGGFFSDRFYGSDCKFVERAVARGVAIQPDGKIVLAGYTSDCYHCSSDFALMRLTSTGSLDTSFSGDGKLTTNFFGHNDEARSVMIQPDGKIVAAGMTQVSGGNYDFALARYNSDGSLDTTFDGDGKVNTDFLGGGDDGAYAMALQPDGRIVAAGGVHTISTGYDFGVARYLSNGSLDTGFPGGGFEAINFAGGTAEEVANGVAIQPDGRIVLAGYAPGVGWDFALARLLPSGAVDASFSGDGKLTTDFAGGDDRASALAIQPDGKIVTVGAAYISPPGSDDFAIARYIGQGHPDFSISATPASQTVLRAGRAQYSIALTSIDGFSGYVTLSVGGLPSLTSGSFSPQTVFVPSGGTGTATLTVATSIGAQQGTYIFTVTGTSGSISHAQNLTLIITGR